MSERRPMVRFVRIAFTVLIILIVIYIGARLCAATYDFGYRIFTEGAVDEGEGREVLISIKDGMSGYDLGRELEQEGLIDNAFLFSVQLRLYDYADDMSPGLYTLSSAMTPKEMMTAIAEAGEQSTENETETEAAEILDLSDEGSTEIGSDEDTLKP